MCVTVSLLHWNRVVWEVMRISRDTAAATKNGFSGYMSVSI